VFKKLIILSALFLTTVSCMKSGNDTLIEDDRHISRGNIGLTAWNIGLETDVIGTGRNTGDDYTISNPRNWITITGDDCQGEGIPSELQGSNCHLDWSESTGGVIGFCYSRFYISGAEEGKIADTTLIIHKNFVESDSVPESEKEAVYVHEIGHCIGLKHPPETDAYKTRIMFPYLVPGVTRPNAGELSAIQDAYNPISEPSTTNRDGYFYTTQANNKTVRHYALPTFYLSPGRFSPFGARSDIGPGPLLKGPVKGVIHKFSYGPAGQKHGLKCSSKTVN
jgi:hypothetical protein